jgi:hypothetical protein
MAEALGRRRLFGMLAGPLAALVGAASVEAAEAPPQVTLTGPCVHEPLEQVPGQPWAFMDIRRLNGSLHHVHVCRHCGVVYALEGPALQGPTFVFYEPKQRALEMAGRPDQRAQDWALAQTPVTDWPAASPPNSPEVEATIERILQQTRAAAAAARSNP